MMLRLSKTQSCAGSISSPNEIATQNVKRMSFCRTNKVHKKKGKASIVDAPILRAMERNQMVKVRWVKEHKEVDDGTHPGCKCDQRHEMVFSHAHTQKRERMMTRHPLIKTVRSLDSPDIHLTSLS